MKTLKERVSELQKEIENRIINGQFSITNIDDYQSNFDFFNKITIDINGLEFSFSVSKSKKYLCLHDGPVIIAWRGYEIGDLKHLYDPIEAMQLETKQKQLKQLQDEIREIQAK